MSDRARRVRIHPSTLSRDVQGETVLLQLDRGEYFGLDAVGTRIWQLMVETSDLDVVLKRMLEEFDVAPDVLAADIDALVKELVSRDLVEFDPSGSVASGHGAGSHP